MGLGLARRDTGDQTRIARLALAILFGGGLSITAASFFYYNDSPAFFLGLFAAYFAYGVASSVFMYVLARRGLEDAHAAQTKPARRRSTVTIAMPAFNERSHLPVSIDSLLAQDESVERIVVVNDGSEDGTLAMLTARYDLKPVGILTRPAVRVYRSRHHPALWVLDQAKAGKAAALNRALEHCDTDLLITADADTVFMPDAVATMRRHFDGDPHLKAAGGMVLACNGRPTEALLAGPASSPSGLLPRLQWIEYATNFVWRFAWARINGLMLMSGSFSGFDAALLRECGGFDERCITEDYEIAYASTIAVDPAASPTVSPRWPMRSPIHWCPKPLPA